MSGYDYGNARIRARASRLLSREALIAFAQSSSVQVLLNALIDTPYRPAVEIATVRRRGTDAVFDALQIDFTANARDFRTFYRGRESEVVALVFRRFDVDNLKAMLRGLSHQAGADEIMRVMLPVGELSRETLADLARAANPRDAIDRLVTLGTPYARPLVSLRAEQPGAELFAMELALERWHDRFMREQVDARLPGAAYLAKALDVEADLTNLLTVLRFVHAPAARRQLSEEAFEEELRALVVGPGRLSVARLIESAEQDTMPGAIAVLNGTVFAELLGAGLDDYRETGRLSVLEERLQAFRLRWMAGLIGKDPLGIGVLLGYLELKRNEVRNIRRIALGIQFGHTAQDIIESLEFAA